MIINLIADDSVTSAPSGFTAAIQAAAYIMDREFTDNITVNIRYGWGTENNVVLSSLNNTNTASGGPVAGSSVSYSTLKSWLSSDAAALPGGYEAAAVNSLPASNSAFPNSANLFFVSSAQEKALGHFSGNSNAVDGAIGFGTATIPTRWTRIALHEIAHALGRTTGFYEHGVPTIMDLFRYDATGEFQWTGGQPAYFSIDGGQTALADYDTVGDYGDFNDDSLTPADPFNLNANASALTAIDVELMDVLGFHSVAPVRNDFTGNGTSDILFQNPDGTPDIWEMNGASIVGGGVLSNPGASWHIEASADFNHNGKADIVLQNADGLPQIWLMNGTTVTSTATLPNPGSSWHVIAADDFNGDGNPDILWQNSDGAAAVWLMNGSTPVGGGALTLDPGPSWKAIGAGDFNGDGKADILWQNTDGQAVIWFMNGTAIIGGGPLPLNPGAAWKAVAIGDFNGDGRADILWQNADGQADIWLMSGTMPIGGGPLPNPGPTWHAIGTSDFNGDGLSDIIWQNTDGTPAIWEMNGINIIGGGVLANPGATWQVKDDGPIPADQMGTASAVSAAPPAGGALHLSALDPSAGAIASALGNSIVPAAGKFVPFST